MENKERTGSKGKEKSLNTPLAFVQDSLTILTLAFIKNSSAASVKVSFLTDAPLGLISTLPPRRSQNHPCFLGLIRPLPLFPLSYLCL